MMEVAGRPIIDHACASVQAAQVCVAEAVVVAGYRAGAVQDFLSAATPPNWTRVIRNHLFKQSGTALSTLLGVQASLPGNLLIAEGDVVFAPEAIDALADAAGPAHSATLTARFGEGLSGSAVRVDGRNRVTAWLRNIDDAAWQCDTALHKTVNLHWIAERHRPALLEALQALVTEDLTASLEAVMHRLVERKVVPIRAVDIGAVPWWEIDDRHDLARANALFG